MVEPARRSDRRGDTRDARRLADGAARSAVGGEGGRAARGGARAGVLVSLLAAVAGLDEAALRQGLARLVEAEIVFARGEPPEATYTFKHALVQEAAYESLLKRTRQQLHGRVVDVLRAVPRARQSEPELVARHAEAAGRSDDAITYYGRAGEQAQARSAHEEAIGHLRKAVALLGRGPRVRNETRARRAAARARGVARCCTRLRAPRDGGRVRASAGTVRGAATPGSAWHPSGWRPSIYSRRG